MKVPHRLLLVSAAALALMAAGIFAFHTSHPGSPPFATLLPALAQSESGEVGAASPVDPPPVAALTAALAAPVAAAQRPGANPSAPVPLAQNTWPAPAPSGAPNPATPAPPAAQAAATPVAVAHAAPARMFAPSGAPLPGQAAAPKAFDSRFVQPATRQGAGMGRTPEAEQRIAADAAKVSAEKAKAVEWAKKNGWPVEGTKFDGGGYELMRLDEDGKPVYYETLNDRARISHNVEPLTQFGSPPGSTINLSGYGWYAGMWEKGPPRLSHQEFNDFPDRVVYLDSGTQDANQGEQDHATHVLGTILGNGVVDSRVRGMAWRASAKCFGWNDDNSEMRTNGATAPEMPGALYVSNHSYAGHFGWTLYQAPHPRANGYTYQWVGTNGEQEARGFGQYGSAARERDITCRMTPYLLPFFAAGNSRNYEPGFLSTVYYTESNGQEFSGTWPFISGYPPANGSQDGGYDTLLSNGSAKNPMIVGNMQDAWSNGQRQTIGVGMVGSSSFGPADDGRIKPDVVANGDDVLSATFDSDTATATKTGTSMAAPGATGTGLLLHEHYYDTTGQYLRASTLKALMIHTATDVQAAGPDYASGWGLIDGVAAVNHLNLHAAEPGAYHLVEGVLSQQAPEFRVSFTATGLVKATLVWTDPEGQAQVGLDARTKVLVNDLDLTLRAPNGTIYRAPQLDPVTPTAAPIYNGNDTDNVEMIGGLPLQLIAPVPGVYELTVTHKGTLTEPDPKDALNLKQVFSLMLQGNVAANTGTIADAVDKPERAFTKHASATTSFAFETNAGANGGDRATNFDIGDGQSAGFETKVKGPVTVTFDWGVSSEVNFDFLRFYSDGVNVSQISGSVASNTVSYAVPAGDHTLRWAYVKDSSVSSGTDSGWIDNLEFNDLGEAVDNLAYAFTEPVGSSAPWRLLAINNSGVPTNDVAESGNIAAQQRSDMETIIQGPALVRFRMVQTGPTGQFRAQWGPNLTSAILHTAGNTWTRYSIELAAGPQTVRWSWFKPQTEASFGYVDELEVIPLPASLRDAVDLPPNSFNLTVDNFAGQPWRANTADAAPSGPGGERGTTSIHSIFTPGASNDTAIRLPIISSRGGVVSFWWQASGAAGGNMALQIRYDSGAPFVQAGPAVGPRKITAIPGGTPWQQVHVEVPPGYTELRFFYDATTSPGQGWIDRIEFQEGLMHPARGLDRWSSRWETFGDAPWHALPDATNGGIDSTTHGPIGNSQSTTLTTNVTGPKKLFFHWKTSSEATYDFLRFLLDGEDAVQPISGETAWQPVAIDIPAGTHVLRWVYQKDNSASAGQDRGWIDQVAILRADYGLGLPVPDPGGAFVLLPVRKDATAGFFVEQTTDFVNWTPVGTGDGMVTPRFTNVNLIIPHPGPKGFYRMRFKPEIVHAIENAGFELPAVGANSFANNAPGWGPDDDAFTATSFEHITGFAAAGTQHLSIDAGFFSEMKGSFLGYRGVHSVMAAIGHRPGFTQPGNLSSIVLTSSAELARVVLSAATQPSGSWFTPAPATFDSFETNLDAAYNYKVRLESTGNRSFFDEIRVVSEPQ